MKHVTTSELAIATGETLASAAREPVVITHHGNAQFVLMTAEAYQELLARQGQRRVLCPGSGEDLETILSIVDGE